MITAGTTIREVLPILKGFGDLQVSDMFISVDRMEYGLTPGKTAVMEVEEEYGLKIRPIVDVGDIREWLVQAGQDPEMLRRMDAYREKYCLR